MSAGELPFKGRDAMSMLLAVTHDQPKPPEKLRADLPPALVRT